MYYRLVLAWVVVGLGFSIAKPSDCSAQATILSATPPNVEYQYQLYYPRLFGWPGPGMSIGGSLPSQGREGISSFWGRPFPVPLGAGIYVNPFSYATQLPGPPNSFGLAASTNSPTNSLAAPVLSATPPIQPMTSANTPGVNPMTPPVGVIPAANLGIDPSRRPIRVSSIALLEKGRQIESFGDEKLKSQQWLQAYINYRNAVMVADDLAEAHVRLGFACMALNRFPQAVLEFKRALFIDPMAGNSGESLASVFGPESQAVRAEMTRSIASWAREDLRDQDRLFLLGVVLHFDEDKRAHEILEAAYRLTGSGDHLLALMTPATAPGKSPRDDSLPPVPAPPESPKLPELHQQPLALH